jgi:hypothetical protein
MILHNKDLRFQTVESSAHFPLASNEVKLHTSKEYQDLPNDAPIKNADFYLQPRLEGRGQKGHRLYIPRDISHKQGRRK